MVATIYFTVTDVGRYTGVQPKLGYILIILILISILFVALTRSRPTSNTNQDIAANNVQELKGYKNHYDR